MTRGPISSLTITFLGTASAQPSSTRNHSSLALRLGGAVWLFDCGEGTQHQIQKCDIKMGKIEKIFITHTHGDHIFGLVPLLATMLNGAGGTAEGDDPRLELDKKHQPLEIYGPYGTRSFVRNTIVYSHTLFARPYVVHELRWPTDPVDDDPLIHAAAAEAPNGRNLMLSDGTWPDIYRDDIVAVSAAPILHSVPCVGFVIHESPVPGKIDIQQYRPDLERTKTPLSVLRRLQQGESVELSDGTILQGPPRRPGRKIVILGDTYDPSPIADIARGADLVVHEATNAHLPHLDSNTKSSDTYESVEERTKSRGHSTPQMAGAFAKRVEAKRLVLNHFSARYSGAEIDDALTIMGGIGDLAAREFGQDVICARDFMTLSIDLPSI